jgi:hypothetical protein
MLAEWDALFRVAIRGRQEAPGRLAMSAKGCGCNLEHSHLTLSASHAQPSLSS